MKIEQQVVSLELAKKLKELGVKQESYFHWGKSAFSGVYGITSTDSRHLAKINEFHDEPGASDYYDLISAFTVAELGEMLPEYINIPYKNGRKRAQDHWLLFRKGYVRYYANAYCDSPHFSANTEADARAKMLIYLIENKLIDIDILNKNV